MVNRYNQSMAAGLRHNHDISMILTRKKGTLASVLYLQLRNQAQRSYVEAIGACRRTLGSSPPKAARRRQAKWVNRLQLRNKTKSFMLRAANRIFTSRELSQPEVLAHLLGFQTDFTNVHAWAWVHLNSLYWACARQWPGLREALSIYLEQEPQADNVYLQADGYKLPYIEAYKHRGPVLQDICFYEYLSFVALKKENARWGGSMPIPFLRTATVCSGWIQWLRAPDKTAIPVLDGHLTDDFDEQEEKFLKR